ncbi:MAG: sensor histidine kinase [Bacteroidia bacterium]
MRRIGWLIPFLPLGWGLLRSLETPAFYPTTDGLIWIKEKEIWITKNAFYLQHIPLNETLKKINYLPVTHQTYKSYVSRALPQEVVVYHMAGTEGEKPYLLSVVSRLSHLPVLSKYVLRGVYGVLSFLFLSGIVLLWPWREKNNSVYPATLRRWTLLSLFYLSGEGMLLQPPFSLEKILLMTQVVVAFLYVAFLSSTWERKHLIQLGGATLCCFLLLFPQPHWQMEVFGLAWGLGVLPYARALWQKIVGFTPLFMTVTLPELYMISFLPLILQVETPLIFFAWRRGARNLWIRLMIQLGVPMVLYGIFFSLPMTEPLRSAAGIGAAFLGHLVMRQLLPLRKPFAFPYEKFGQVQDLQGIQKLLEEALQILSPTSQVSLEALPDKGTPESSYSRLLGAENLPSTVLSHLRHQAPDWSYWLGSYQEKEIWVLIFCPDAPIEMREIIETLISHARSALQRLHLIQREKHLLQATYEAQLQALRAQIHPHFLFNALNSLQNLIYESAQEAESFLQRLAILLRQSFEHSQKTWVSLHDEVQLVEAYISLEKSRYEERIEVVWHLPDRLPELQVPPFFLQILVENVFRHVVSKVSYRIRLELHLQPQADQLYIVVQDNGPGIELERIKQRTGLRNLIQRLNIAYGSAARIDFYRLEPGTRVIVSLPYKVSSS